jgi:hypothetical protein
MNPVLSATVASDNWRTSLYNRVAEVIDAYRDLGANSTPPYDETPGYQAASQRLEAALRALPFWLRWIFC